MDLKFQDKTIQQLSNLDRVYYYSIIKHEVSSLHSLLELAEWLRSEGFELDDAFNSAYDICLAMYKRTGIADFSYFEGLYGVFIPIFLNGQWQACVQVESPKKLVLALYWIEEQGANADELYNKLLDLKVIGL